MAEARPKPEECPEPFWHETHRYCPACTWTEDDSEGTGKQSPAEPQGEQR